MSRTRNEALEEAANSLNAHARIQLRAVMAKTCVGDAELARRLEVVPTVITRRFTEEETGLTLATVARMAHAMGHTVALLITPIAK